MQLKELALSQVVDIKQFQRLAHRLATYNLVLEMLDHQGRVVVPPSVDPSPCGQAASRNGCAAPACGRQRHEICTVVLKEGQPRVISCPGSGTLVGIPIRPFATVLGAVIACHAPPCAPMATVPAKAGHVNGTPLADADLIALLTTLLNPFIEAGVRRIESEDLAQELLSRYEQLNFVFELAHQVNPTRDLSSTFDFITDKIAQLFGVGYIITIFRNNAIDRLTVAPGQQRLPMFALADATQRLCQSVASQVCRSNQTVVLNDLQAWQRQGDPASLFAAILATPILVDSQYYGTLNILNTSLIGRFTNGDVALIESVGKQMGIFIENHYLYQKLQAFHRAQKMEAIGQLAGGIAHDFNNILTAILGYGDLTRDDLPEGSRPRRNLEQILKAGYRAKDLVQQILAFSRQQHQERQPVHLAAIVEETLKLLRATLPATIEIHEDLDPACGAVFADPTQLHQVVLNLCTNASQAMEEHGGILELRVAAVEIDADVAAFKDIRPGMYMRLTVRDTGCGMTPEVMEHMFDPFFTTKPVGEGTGLGLAAVHGIVKSHEGAIFVHSERGKGTTFHILFPRIESPEALPAAGDVPIPMGKERVLFVDDEEALAHLVQQMLTRLGYEVVCTTNSLEALEVFRARPDTFDVVITDMTMPRMTGNELARELLRLRPDIPIILLSGYHKAVGPEQARAIGIRECIMKPISSFDLGKAIRRVLEDDRR